MYKSDEQGERYECDHCGARLPAPTAEGTRTCSYCGSVYTTKQDAQAPGGYTFVVQSPPTIDISQFYDPQGIAEATRSSAKFGCILSVVITILVVAGVSIPLYFAFSDADFFEGVGVPGQSYDVSSGSGIVLPGEPSAIEVAVRAQRYEGEVRGYVTGLGGNPLTEQWQSSALPEDAYQVTMAADADNVYAVAEKRLVALRRSDGGELWQASLSDTVTSCPECVQVFGGTVVVRTGDGVLQAFGTAGGEPAWRRELDSSSTPATRVGDTLVVGTGTSSDGSLLVLNPLDGTELHVLDAQCSDGRSSSRAGANDTVEPSPDDATFVIGFGTIPSCLQRWDAATGALVWSQTLDSGTSFGSFDDTPALWSPTLVAIPSSSDIMVVDRNTGTLVTLLQPDQEELWPIGFTDTAMITLVEDQRGTNEYGVRALDLATWQPLWDQALTGTPTQWMTSPTVSSNEGAVAVAVVGPSVRTVSLDGEEQDLDVVSIDVATGAASATTTLETGFNATIASFEVLGWVGDTAVLIAADDLVLVDTLTPTITSSWP